ncbi:MAG: glycerol-3-phosphate dehydrogenase/oxidase [Myxococcota bacterium]
MKRDDARARIFEGDGTAWDVAVIGGGATGIGVAVDAASRGYSVCLVEQSDFGKGTSSRSTKLVHGGVRYLQQGNVSLVMEALRERGRLRQNAPHLVRDLAFVVPNYDWWETPFYGIGMKVYDKLAGKYGFGRSRVLSREETLGRIPTLATEGLRGGVLYYDGQFDDARLLVSLARTATAHGAALMNYVRCVGLNKDDDGFVDGLDVEDLATGRRARVPARCVVNATGAFSDAVRRLDDPAAEAMIAPSQGVHVVLDGRFLGGESAIMVPRTSDGRVLFAIPWHGMTVVGTTDTSIETPELEPRALPEEIAFILETAADYLSEPPARTDVRSVFVGIRPLVKAPGASSTAALSRDHTIHISPSGLLTIAGGKWTTYRNMAEDCVDHAITLGRLDEHACVTKELAVVGATDTSHDGPLAVYGSDADAIAALDATPIHPRLPITAGQVDWAVAHEMAQTVDDVLARRTRALLLDARAAAEAAPAVARRIAEALGHDRAWADAQTKAFVGLAAQYQLGPE